jgi:DNA-binding transcriptional ArsR family regulator
MGMTFLPPSSTDARVIRAYSHPVRARVMEILEARLASPSEIAATLGLPVGSAAYHVRQLEKAGLVNFAERRRSAGATQRLYTAVTAPTITDNEWRTLPVFERRAVMAGGLERFGPEFAAASARDGFDRDGARMTIMSGPLDSNGWVRASASLLRALERFEDAVTDAKVRMAELTVPVRTARIAMMLFKDPPVARPGDEDNLGRFDIGGPALRAALTHPLRLEVLRLLDGRAASPSDVARHLALPVARVSYHVGRLRELGLIELTHTTERRGAVEHYFRRVPQPKVPGWLDSLEDSYARKTMTAVDAAARGGGFDHDDIHFTRTLLPIDDQAWRQVGGELESLSSELGPLMTSTASRRGSDVHVDRATIVLMLFERAADVPPAVAPNPAAGAARSRRSASGRAT